VVVVVTGAGTVVCEDVVVVLCVGSLAQAESEMAATAIRQGTMSFFMGMILVLIVIGTIHSTPPTPCRVWGVCLFEPASVGVIRSVDNFQPIQAGKFAGWWPYASRSAGNNSGRLTFLLRRSGVFSAVQHRNRTHGSESN
jgi:hypothetical protein